MTSKQTLRREITIINRALNIHAQQHYLIFHYGPTDEPHGAMGHRAKKWTTANDIAPKVYAISYDEEMKSYTEDEYNWLKLKISAMKNPEHAWNTYKKWIEYNRCKCGKHGVDGKQPYGEVYE